MLAIVPALRLHNAHSSDEVKQEVVAVVRVRVDECKSKACREPLNNGSCATIIGELRTSPLLSCLIGAEFEGVHSYLIPNLFASDVKHCFVIILESSRILVVFRYSEQWFIIIDIIRTNVFTSPHRQSSVLEIICFRTKSSLVWK